MRKFLVGVPWWVQMLLFGVVGSCAQGAEPLPGAYEACGDDASTVCRDQLTMRCGVLDGERICLSQCRSTSSCPPHPEGTPVICLNGECVPDTCHGPLRGDREWACVNGEYRRCSELEDPPCSQCGYCPRGAYCDPGRDECVPAGEAGAACEHDEMCQSVDCVGGVCQVPIGVPCSFGDLCPLCIDGICTRECAVRSGEVTGGCRHSELRTVCSADLGERDDGNPYTLAGYCHLRCDGGSCPDGMACVVPAGYFSITDVRACVSLE